jgi:pimeloyl-ACP methyl ester carboxylesterase
MIILFPGLGGDEQLFAHLQFSEQTFFVEYPVPDERMEWKEFCRLTGEKIPHSNEYVFIGVSFGGLIAQSLAKEFPVKKIILLSSLKTQEELPFRLRIFRSLPLYKWLPEKNLRQLIHKLSRSLTRKNEMEASYFLHRLQQTDIQMIRKGIEWTLCWKAIPSAIPVVQVHGNRDLLFPVQRVHPDFVVQGGQHFFMMTHYETLNKILDDILNEPATQSVLSG